MNRRRPEEASGTGAAAALPAEVRSSIERAGYYPALVQQVVSTALAGELVDAHLVHQETTFDAEAVRRHVTVLAVTPTRLVVAHADDHGPDEQSPSAYATASTEAVPLGDVRTVVLSRTVAAPERYRGGQTPLELSLTIGWGSVQRVDLEPATCGDPECDADHGYTGTLTGDDIALRVSADAEGQGAVRAAVDFAAALSTAVRPR
jgi:hypothetical protein